MRTYFALTLLGLSALMTGCNRDAGKGSSADIDLGNGYKLIATRTDGTNPAKCQTDAEDLLNKRPNVACLIGLWAYNPPALLRATRSAGKKVPIVAFDENDQTLAGIKDGSIEGTIVQDPYQFGYQAIEILAELVKGNDDVLKTWPGIEKDHCIFVKHRIITKDNVDKFRDDVKNLLGERTAAGDTTGMPRVAFVTNNTDPFWTFAERGAEKAAAKHGVHLMFRKPSDGSAQAQRVIIEDLILKQCKGIAVSPNDSKNAQKYFKDEVASKVALVMTDNDLPDPSARRCYIGTHNYRAGRAAGELVKKAIPKGGEVAIFVGQMDSTNAVERRQGVLDVLAGKDRTEMGEITPVQ